MKTVTQQPRPASGTHTPAIVLDIASISPMTVDEARLRLALSIKHARQTTDGVYGAGEADAYLTGLTHALAAITPSLRGRDVLNYAASLVSS